MIPFENKDLNGRNKSTSNQESNKVISLIVNYTLVLIKPYKSLDRGNQKLVKITFD